MFARPCRPQVQAGKHGASFEFRTGENVLLATGSFAEEESGDGDTDLGFDGVEGVSPKDLDF